MAIDFARHNRHSEDYSGHFIFTLSDVEYGHDGIKNLSHLIPMPEPVIHAISGTWVFTNSRDATDWRAPKQLECSVDGQAELIWRLRLPLDFGAFFDDCLEFETSINGSPTVTAYLYHAATADATISALDVTPASPDVWERSALLPGDTYLRGEWVTLRLTVDAVAGERAAFSDASFGYLSGAGNVVGVVG